MKRGIVACPVHGDNETTPNCPDCRPYNMKTNKKTIDWKLREILVEGKTYDVIANDLKNYFRQLSLQVIGEIQPTGKWPLYQNHRIVNRNALKREQYKRLSRIGIDYKKYEE